MKSVRETFPEFAHELVTLVEFSERPELAAQVLTLPVLGRCRCGQGNCALFYTAPPPQGPYGTGHHNIILASKTGLIVLDVVGDAIVAVEILDRPDVKLALDAVLPFTG